MAVTSLLFSLSASPLWAKTEPVVKDNPVVDYNELDIDPTTKEIIEDLQLAANPTELRQIAAKHNIIVVEADAKELPKIMPGDSVIIIKEDPEKDPKTERLVWQLLTAVDSVSTVRWALGSIASFSFKAVGLTLATGIAAIYGYAVSYGHRPTASTESNGLFVLGLIAKAGTSVVGAYRFNRKIGDGLFWLIAGPQVELEEQYNSKSR